MKIYVTLPVNMTPFSKEKILIKSLYECKGYNAGQFIIEFPDKGWTKSSIDRLLVKLRKFGTVDRRPGSSRGRSARTDENVDTVESLVLSQEDKPPNSQRNFKRGGDPSVVGFADYSQRSASQVLQEIARSTAD